MSDESVVHAIAEAKTLRTFISTLTPLVSECKLHMSSEGWQVSAVDPANVAMIDRCDLAPRAFEAFDAPGAVTVGINLERFEEYLDPADADQLVDVNVNMERRHLELTYGTTETSMALIDPEAIRAEPDSPPLDLPNEVVLEGSDLDHAVTVADIMGDHLSIVGEPDERHVAFTSQGDKDDVAVTYGDEEVIDASIDEECESLFSLDYMIDLVDPIPDDAEVTVRFTEEMPVKMDWQNLGGDLDVQQTLAPRIQRR